MAYLPAVCPKCDHLILCQEGAVFVNCPSCSKNISSDRAVTLMRELCAKPDNVKQVIAEAVKLERQHGPELPLAILSILGENFPMNEDVAYLILRMSNYPPQMVCDYLTRFKSNKRKYYPPFAEEFLTSTLTFRNMKFVEHFEEYVAKRLPQMRQDRYNELIAELKKQYTGASTSHTALILLYTHYIGCALVNITLTMLYIFLWSWPLFAFALLTLGVLGAQIGLLFAHNRIFGNRLASNKSERIAMIVFTCSIVLVIGGTFLGMFVNF